VSLGTFISRITGLIRLQVIAYLFGYSQATDAFWFAFSIPNLLRALFAEGALSSGFIPVFSEYSSLKGDKEALKLANNVLNLLLIITGPFVILGIFLAPFYIPLIAVGFRQNFSQLKLTVYLTQIMWPFLLFISIAALFMAVLNCRGHFTSPAFAPVLFNLSLVFFAWIFIDKIGIYSLAFGVVMGGMLHFFIQLPFLIKKGFKYRFTLCLKDEGTKKVLKLVLPAFLGGATLQASVLITRIFASTLPEGSISALQYAMRLIQFPLGLFPIALSTAFFPHLSTLAAEGDREGIKKSVSMGMRVIFFLLIPSAVGLVMLRKELVAVLFQHGAFSLKDTLLTGQALFGYSIGLFAMGACMILTRAFYSLQDFLTPLKISFLSLLVSILFNFILIGPLKVEGLALATSLSSIFNMLALIYLLRKRLNDIEGYSILKSFIKSSFAGLSAGFFIYLLSRIFKYLGVGFSFPQMIFYVVLCVVSGFFIVIILSLLLKSEELSIALSFLSRRK